MTEDIEKVKILLLIVFCGIVLSQETSHEKYAKILGLSKPGVLKKCLVKQPETVEILCFF